MTPEVKRSLLLSFGERGALYLEELERRIEALEGQMNPPEPDPLEVGTDVFRQTTKIKDRALKRRV